MTTILNFTLKIKGGGREGGTCEVLRPCHPPPPNKKNLERASLYRVRLVLCRKNDKKVWTKDDTRVDFKTQYEFKYPRFICSIMLFPCACERVAN